MSDSLAKKLHKFLNRDFREQLEKRDKLRKMLATMRKKQKSLEGELAEEYDPQIQEKIRGKLRVLKGQRRKGVDLLQELRQQSEED